MSWGLGGWGLDGFGGGGAPGSPINIVAGLQAGPRVFEIRFDRNAKGDDGTLVSTANWTVVRIAGSGPTPLTVLLIDKPVGSTHPARVYVYVAEVPGDGATYRVTVNGITAEDGGPLGTNTADIVTTVLKPPYEPMEAKLREHLDRLSSVRAWAVREDPTWEALVHAQAIVDGLLGGSRTSRLLGDVSVGADVVVTLDPGPFDLTEIPAGALDGSNRTFRLQHTFDWKRVEALVGPLDPVNFSATPAFRDDWYAPGGGDERLLRFITPPDRGGFVLLRYTPRRGVIRIDEEIIVYTATPAQLDAKQIVLHKRAQMGTTAATHAAQALAYDVWGASFLDTIVSGMSFRTGVDSLLAIRAKDIGVERVPEYLDDRSFRRVLLNVGTGPKNTYQIARTAMQYLYRTLWPHILVTEDPRWPRALAVWYSPTIQLQPPIADPEIWEDWLEEPVLQDGTHPAFGYTFLHADADDLAYPSAFATSDPADDGGDPSYPIIISGDDIFSIGIPNDPPPPFPDTSYRSLLIKPRELERILPSGTGLLLLKYPS